MAESSAPPPAWTKARADITDGSASDPSDLVRELARLLSRTEEPRTLHELDGEVIEVVIDFESEGLRVLITRRDPRPSRTVVVLSPREREIARMVARGLPNKTIAGVLEISSWTVCTYLRRIFAKLNVCSRAAMVARLIEEGQLNDYAQNRNSQASIFSTRYVQPEEPRS